MSPRHRLIKKYERTDEKDEMAPEGEDKRKQREKTIVRLLTVLKRLYKAENTLYHSKQN
jgi:hypothetical protein